MQFTVGERFFLFNLLHSDTEPVNTYRTIRKLRLALSFTEEEVKETNFRDDPDRPGCVIWDCGTANPPEIEVTEAARQIIAGRLRRMIESGEEVHTSLMGLFDEFVPEESEQD